ncbi:monocarboxylate transporter 14-like [Macrosteles quadrilineatus]|uniref:monocarboxylate transporter 14-like n=1 Tax=Macrosteles quadrilineatus TaxID=74068 RepID=UPI0023E2A593|nr:monocarboxylate transporter 14-like [Macrosteles quadrilineatus]
MEPLLDKENRVNGLAPIVRWSNPTPTSESPSSRQSPTKSGSSGIGPDSPAGTPTVASSGEEPNLFASTPSAISCNNNESPENATTIIENPGYEVKFKEPEIADSIISSDSYMDEDSEEDKPKIPDGGWGWVVVMASLVISMIADGISFSFGLLFLEFLKEFEASKSATSWIGSLFMAVPLMSGPICSALVDRYGCRWMTILGGLISGLGFILSTFCDTIYLMYLTFGVIAGIGLGLCYVTAVVSIAYWFDKKRTLATSLGACGTGIGTFVYAPMTQFFINEFGWRGTVLLLAGTFFNMCVCGAVMRDPEWWTEEQNKGGTLSKQSKNTSSCGSISGRSAASEFPGVEEIRKMMKSGETPEYLLTALATSMKKEGEEAPADGNIHNFHSVVNLPTFIRQNEKVPLEVLESLKANQRLYNLIVENYPSLLLCRSISDHGHLNKAGMGEVISTRVPVPVTMSVKVKPHAKKTEITSPLNDSVTQPLVPEAREVTVIENKEEDATSPSEVGHRELKSRGVPPARVDSVPWLRRQFSLKENTNPHYLKHIKVHRDSVMYRGAMLNIHKYHLRATSCPDIYRNSMTTIAREAPENWREDLKELLSDMMDFSMFLELHFLLMSLATILLFTWFIVPYFYITDFMKVYGMTEDQGSVIISVIGITNTIGMIGLGWAGDQPWMNVPKVYAVCLVACGISIIGMPLMMFNYYLLMVTCALFGIFFASNFSFTPTILVQLIPLERFTTAYGLVLLCQGIGNLLGPPLAGWMFDLTQDWDLSFYMAGVWIIVSGVLVAFIPYTKNRLIWGEGTLEKDKDSIA